MKNIVLHFGTKTSGLNIEDGRYFWVVLIVGL